MHSPNRHSPAPSAPPMPSSYVESTSSSYSEPANFDGKFPYSQPYFAPYQQPTSMPSNTNVPGCCSMSYPSHQQFYGRESPFPAGTDPEIVQAFLSADRDGNGAVDAFELQIALSATQSFRSVSLRTVRLMIHLFGSRNSTLGPMEFVALWKALKEWKNIFERFDQDHSGSIDKIEMRDALLSLGYAIPSPILNCLVEKYDRTGQAKAMDYDSFVECGLVVKGLTEKFKQQDRQLTGYATLDYQTFMLMVLPFIVA